MVAGDTLSEGVQLMELLVEQLDRTTSQTTTLGIHQLTEAAALASLTAHLTSVLPRGELCRVYDSQQPHCPARISVAPW